MQTADSSRHNRARGMASVGKNEAFRFENPQHRHHRPRRPRQDDAGGRHAAPERRIPRQSGARRPRDGLQRAGARARHHHPGQEHRRFLPRGEDQHRGHARPQRFRRRGGARAEDGGRRHAAGGRQRRSAAADALRAAQGARSQAAAHRGHQQDRPPRRPPAGSAERDLRPVHRSRRHRRSARVSRALHQRQAGHGNDATPRRRPEPAAAV